MGNLRIAIIGNARQGRSTLRETVLSEMVRNSEELKLLQDYMDTGIEPYQIELIQEDNKFLQTQNKEYREEIFKLRDWIDKNINDAHREVSL